MNDTIKHVLALVIVSGISFSVGKYLVEPSVQEKIVYKENTSIKTNTDRVVDKVQTTKPDGTKTTEWKIRTVKSTEKEESKDLNKEKITEQRKDWLVSLTYQPSLIDMQNQNISLGIQKRMFSEIYVGGTVSTNKTFGITIGVGF